MAAAKPGPMPTEKIQEMLEENFRYIKAIAEQQNLGRMQEVHQYQQKLQENLMLLAAVADAYSPAAMAATQANAAVAAAQAAQAGRPQGAAAGVSPAPGAQPGGQMQFTPAQVQQVLQQALARQQQMQQAGAAAGGQQAQQGAGGFTLPGAPPLNLNSS